jgi:transcriptional regulator with XRE-family HTH domain
MAGPRLQQVRLLGELRALRGVSQQRLAESLGMTQSAISKLEQRDDPSFQTLRAFVEVLGGSLHAELRFPNGTFEFVSGDEEPPASR